MSVSKILLTLCFLAYAVNSFCAPPVIYRSIGRDGVALPPFQSVCNILPLSEADLLSSAPLIFGYSHTEPTVKLFHITTESLVSLANKANGTEITSFDDFMWSIMDSTDNVPSDILGANVLGLYYPTDKRIYMFKVHYSDAPPVEQLHDEKLKKFISGLAHYYSIGKDQALEREMEQ